MSNTPKNKRLKKQRLDDYKNLNWKLFKMNPKEKGKRAAEPDFPNKVSLLTSSPPFAIPVSGWAQSQCQPCLMSPLTQGPSGGETEHSGASVPLLPTDLGSAGAGTDGHPQAEPRPFPSSATGRAAAPDLPGSFSAAAWTALLWASR